VQRHGYTSVHADAPQSMGQGADDVRQAPYLGQGAHLDGNGQDG
jgi:hypothetical protein